MNKHTSESYLIIGAIVSFLLSPVAAHFISSFFVNLACRSTKVEFLCGFSEGIAAYVTTFAFFIILGVILLAVSFSLRVKRKTRSTNTKKKL